MSEGPTLLSWAEKVRRVADFIEELVAWSGDRERAEREAETVLVAIGDANV